MRLLVLLSLWGFALAGTLYIPPAPSPLPALGISIRDVLDKAGLRGYDPILLAKKNTSGSDCPPGYELVRLSQVSSNNSNQQGTVNGINNGVQQFQNSGMALCQPKDTQQAYMDSLLQWLSVVVGAVLSQFTGNEVADYIFGDRRALYLSDVLSGLCKAWNTDQKVIDILSASSDGKTVNLLGETICAFSDTYTRILQVIRLAYVYGDAAVNTYIGQIVSRAVAGILEQPINNLKAEIIRGYNNLPFAEPLRNTARDIQRIVDQLAGQVEEFIYFNTRSRTNPYIDSTLAWLVAQGVTLYEEARQQQNEGNMDSFSNSGSTNNVSVEKLPPEKMAMIMASSSPRVLQQIQAVGESQEKLRAEITNYYANLAERGKKVKEAALEDASKRSGGEVDPNIAGKLAEQARQFTDERSLLIQMIEANHVIASSQIRQDQRIEALLAALVEQSAITNEAIAFKAREEIEAQIQALEQIKQQIVDAAIGFSQEISQTATVLDGTAALIGSLAVDRAGVILSEEEFKRLTEGQQIRAP